ncbi:tyrosine-type recombinase/integrase [Gracilibacillus salinarum]|uniref:Tyrosine-type recombinase/integrase n=1 Tax=Gracilibacillus salinarum TaxID=2932255 RepID=A0ABY4GK08_9BACI|nr:tyrosine-type recombinase/integrase [Gracilibacillus salinarum]UOQ84320.1 tyrosine-type recombinase/integrase [Gracilibacillus salinarum]
MVKPIRKFRKNNLAIVHLVRYVGVRPKEIALLNINNVNLAQSLIEIKGEGSRRTYRLPKSHMTYIRDYLKTIDPLKKPTWKSDQPLFVAFNNQSKDYQYDYRNDQPKRLSARSIQKMIKDEVQLAGLRKLSAKHLRNSCILDHIQRGRSEKEILAHFHLTHRYSLRRYKQYAMVLED